MLNQKSPRVLFIIFALAAIILSPIILAFLPLVVVETMYFSRENIVLLTPRRNFILLAGAIVLLIAILVLFAWKRTIYSYGLAVFLLAGSVSMLYYSMLSYTAIHEGGIVLKEYHTVKDYAWSDIAEVIYEYETYSPGVYTFTTTLGETLQIQENGQFSPDERSAIYRVVMERGISFTEREKGSD